MARNPRYYAAGGWKARERMLRLCRERAAAGEPCGICGQPIDLTRPQWITDADGKKKRAPWSCECDEIIPVSRGGSPTDPGNVQPAHRICNQRKGAGKPVKVDQPLKHDVTSGENAERW